MRILLVTMDYPPPMGGIQVVAKNLEEDLSAAGHDVYLVNVDGRNTNNYRKFRPIDLFPNKATRNSYFHPKHLFSPARLFRSGGYRDFVYNNLIYRLAQSARRRFRPDITHILKETLYSAIYECPEPFVVSCHGGDSSLIENIFPVNYSLTHAAMIHCVSNYVQGLVTKIIGEETSRVRVIYNTVDRTIFREHTDAKENIITTCCRLVEGKNVDSVIKAMALLPETLLRRYRHVVMGDGPQLGYLKALVQELKLDNIEFIGEVKDQQEVSQWLGRSKLFVLCPKSYLGDVKSAEEGFGLSFIEAQASGTPVIASRRGGIPEVVGDSGLLVEDPTDPQEIASKIQLALEDSHLYDKLRGNISRRMQQFDRKNAIKAFQQLYEDALTTT